MTIELSPRRFLEMRLSEPAIRSSLTMELGGDYAYYYCGEKVRVVRRDPNIQWHVDHWRAQWDDYVWRAARSTG